MTDPQNIVLDMLRAVRGDLAEVKASIADLKDGQISIPEEIQAMRRDSLRQERTIAAVQVDLDRVKARLELSDA
jgi:phage shock protein A